MTAGDLLRFVRRLTARQLFLSLCLESVGESAMVSHEIATAPLAPQLLLLPPAIVALQPVMDTRLSKAKPKKQWEIVQAEVAGSALARLSAVQLRQQCSASGIQWRNAHGRGRHLLEQETINRLIA